MTAEPLETFVFRRRSGTSFRDGADGFMKLIDSYAWTYCVPRDAEYIDID